MKRWAGCLVLYAAVTGGAGAFGRSPLPENSERAIYPQGTRVLIIGLSRYADPSWPVLNGQRDAERIQKMFLDRGVAPAAITVSFPVPGGAPSLEETIVRFGEQLPPEAAGTRVVVYIAGHGYTADGIGYLVPPDAPDPVARSADFKVKALPVTTLLTRVAAFHAAHVLLILDACFSGLALESLPRERFPHPRPVAEDQTRVLQVITAGSAGQTVLDDGRFAELVISGLVGAADLNFDGWISGTELGMYLRLRMTEITGGRQTPTFGNAVLGREGVEGENWFASPQLALQTTQRPVVSRDFGSAAFRDCDECPLLRVVPAPQGARETSASYLAMGIHEVTLDEYDACFRAGACTHFAWTESGARGSLPVTDVNREDAQTYTRWLSCLTDDRYRLPTDAEWMAAAESERERFARSSADKPAIANCRGCGGTSTGRSTIAVGSFAPSEYGLYDLVGNVWEWVADCAGVAQAPCPQGVVRGGAFTTRQSVAVTLPNGKLLATTRDRNIGFRVVRELGGASPVALGWCAQAAVR